MKKQLLLLPLCAFIWAIAALGFAAPPDKPAQFSYVHDYAGVMTGEQKTRINAAGRELEQKTKAQVIAVTVPSLEGGAPEEYALAILRGWGVGDAKLNNGVVVLVATEDRISRIEVGYGLEGALPDGKTGEIRDAYMLPYFQKGDYGSGIENGYMALVKAAAGEYRAVSNEPASAESQWSWTDLLAAAAVIVILLLDWVFFGGALTRLFLAILASRRGGGGGGSGGKYGGGSGGGGGSTGKW